MPARSSRGTRFTSVFASILFLASCLTPVPGSAQEQPRLDRVVMATSGMGWLSFAGSTGRDGSVPLDLPAGQLDDALKSLTVAGTAATALKLRQVTIGGRGVLADPFQDTPLRPEDLSSLSRLLDRMRGAMVVVDGDPPVRGRIIGVENRESGEDGVAVSRPVLVVMTEQGLVSADLRDADAVRFDEAEEQRSLRTVLERTAQARSGERRTLQIETDAPQGTSVSLGLLVETPVWKPTWRLLLGKDDARIQGWAVVENRTGQDWQGVQLTLVDGDADTLRQELTRTWHRERPEVPVVSDRGNTPTMPALMARSAKSAEMFAAAPAMADEAASNGGAETVPVVEATGTEADLATTFAIEAPVDVADDGSLMVPLLDRALPVERIAFVPADGGGGAPQSAIRLTNATGTTLPRGIVTVVDVSGAAPVHVGDAVLPLVPAGAERRLAFGLDRKIAYSIDQNDTRSLETLTLVDGVLTLTVAERQERRWQFRSDDDQPRQLDVEAWVPAGSRAVVPPDPRREGDRWYIGGTLPARGKASLSLVTERPVEERFVLTTDDTLDPIMAARGLSVPDAWKPKLAEISALSARRAEAERRLTQLAEERAGIVAEQERVRANLESVSEAGPLRERWLGELGVQEDRLAALEGERRQTVVARDEAAAALRAVVTELRQ
jgi:hypothetical protein